MGGVLPWFRDKSSLFFWRFGIHCATHQIRLILISGLVITSLFYPALVIYSSSVPKPLPSYSTHVLDNIFPAKGRNAPLFKDDLENVWAGYDALRISEDPVTRTRCGVEKTVRVERVIVTSRRFDSEAGVINHQMLLSTLDLETKISDSLTFDNLYCLLSESKRCIHMSPLEFWAHNEQAISSDTDLTQTINSNHNLSISGLPLKPAMVFSGRESAEPHGSSVDFASFLAITYLFNEDDCNGSTGHNAWIKLLDESISSAGEVSLETQEPLLLALEFDTEAKRKQRVSLITVTLYLSYLIFFVYFSGSMRRMDTVHSRVGLCFTGLVEILVSTITSLSVCALGGLRITLVPWGIFPILIVFVGAENMFRLVDEVVKTPITLPVKERIGQGLSRAGTSNTMKVVSYNAILGVIGFFAQGAIRQFCVFAIVVLVAHWFLIHTFFVAVLSIDIQRLELDDLLRQGASLGPSAKKQVLAPSSSTTYTPLSKVLIWIRQLTKGRLTRNVSLLLMLAITSTLYYSTLPPNISRGTPEVQLPISRASVMRSKAEQSKLDAHVDAQKIWHTLNPENDPFLHLRIEAPVTVTLNMQYEETRNNSRWPVRLRFLWWITEVVVLPIGLTLGCLYGLLLYLLKGTDRLDGHRGEVEDEAGSICAPLEDQPSFITLPRAFATDVSRVDSSGDGMVVASISAEGEAFLWLAKTHTCININVDDLVLQSSTHSASNWSLTSIAVDERGGYCAIGTSTGMIGLWSVHGDSIAPLENIFIPDCTEPVTHLTLVPLKNIPLSESDPSIDSDHEQVCVFAVLNDRHIMQWRGRRPSLCQPACIGVLKAFLIDMPDTAFPLCCFSTSDGGIEVLDTSQTMISEGSIHVRAGDYNDLVVNAQVCIVVVNNTPHVIVAAVTFSGVITLWDGTTDDQIYTLDDNFGPVNNLRLHAGPTKACPQCGEVPLCAFTLAYSIGHVIAIDRAVLARRCSCPLTQPLVSKVASAKENAIGRRSRSGSFVSSSAADGPLRPRSRHVSISGDQPPVDVNTFPVSAHGLHSRRGSERDNSRRNSERYDRPSLHIFDDSGELSDPQMLSVFDRTRSASSGTTIPDLGLWSNFRLTRVCETTCERGGWDLLGSRIMGIRRRHRDRRHREQLVKLQERSRKLPDDGCSLSSSVLDRWEVWIYDPNRTVVTLQASPLSALKLSHGKDGKKCLEWQRSTPRLAFTRLSPLTVKGSVCLAGFGNTIGVIDFDQF